MGKLPSSFIEEVLSRTDIVEVIGERLRLTKSGKEYRALCPFHQEDTPSFYVSPEKQVYHCFGCGASGNVITFLMEYEKLTFSEAVKELARRAGLDIPEESGERFSVLYEINQFACDFYHRYLLSDQGKRAREYLKERGVEDRIIEEFKLGYAPPEGTTFLKKAKERFRLQDVERAGLAIRRERGYVDRFRRRIMFPIFSTSGKVIAFGGRILGEGEPKYLNSPDTPIYRKGSNFYSLYHSKNALREKRTCILVEGYFDYLSLYQGGIKNVLASLGTAFTDSQASILSRNVEKVYLFYDADQAGRRASLRGIELLVSSGLEIKIGIMENEKDPDELMRKEGKEGIERVMEQAVDFVDFVVEELRRKYDLSRMKHKELAIREVKELLSRIKHPVRRKLYQEAFAGRLAVVSSVFDEKEKPHKKPLTVPSFSPQDLEIELISLLLQFPHFLSSLDFLSPDDLELPIAREVMRRMHAGDIPSFVSVMEELEPSQRKTYTRAAFSNHEHENEDEIRDYTVKLGAKLKRLSLERQLLRIRREIEEKERRGEPVDLLLRQQQEILSERKKIANLGR